MSTAYERARKAARMRARRRAIAYGTWSPAPLVDAAPAVEHIAALRAYGLSLRAIEEIAGGPPGSLADLAYPGHHQHPAQVTPERAEKVLAVRFDLDAIPAHRQVDVSGTRRRIQALSRAGWPMQHLAELLGVTVSTISAYTKPTRKRVLVRVARAVRAVYDDLAMTPGDSKRAAMWAERRGWPPPLAWDDESIDDPAATPWTPTADRDDVDPVVVARAVAGDRPARMSRAERAEATRVLTERGLSAAQIADLIGVTDRTVTRMRRVA